MGYFEVLKAGLAADFEPDVIDRLFSENSHVMHRDLFREQKDQLVLVKGSSKSRLFPIPDPQPKSPIIMGTEAPP